MLVFEKDSDCELWYKKLKSFCVQEDFHSDYKMSVKLGHGSFSKVYDAVHRKKLKRVAIKSLRKADLEKDKPFANAMLNEISILRRVKHKRIIRLYDVFETKKHINLVFEYMGGGTLMQRIKERESKVFSEETTLHIFTRLMEAIAYLHNLNIVHRDLKLDNIFLQ